MADYRVELQGYNDGLPYQVHKTSDKEDAEEHLMIAREDNTKVKFRLIEVLDDFED